MTIAIAWVRTITDCEELVFVTDSRLSGDGRNFDGCPKAIILPRGDCAIAFAGYSGHAYPLMQQLSLAIESHGPLHRGSLDLFSLRSHALKVFDGMSKLIASSEKLSSPVSATPEANFIFGGYSWIKKEFEIWTISYRPLVKQFVADPAKWLSYSHGAKKVVVRKKRTGRRLGLAGKIAFAGDQAGDAIKLLSERLESEYDSEEPISLDMEPFEVVRDMLRNESHSETIGGAPQVIKVYQYMRAAPLGIYWPRKKGGLVHLQGRPCLGYERTDRWVLDPDTLKSERPANYYDEPTTKGQSP